MGARARLGLAIAALCAGIAMTALCAPLASAAAGGISGTVTEAGSGTPVEGAQLCAFPKEHEFTAGQFCVYSGLDGKYALSGLPADDYLLEFNAVYLNFIPQFFPEEDEIAKAKVVTLGEGEMLTGKDAHLTVAAKIAGTVTDATSDAGVEGVEVCAFAKVGFNIGCGISGAGGAYAIPGLYADEYVVAFFPANDSSYVTQYYEGVFAEAEAKPVSVALGEVKPNIDAAMTIGATVTGRVAAANGGAALGGVEVCALHAESRARERCVKTAPDGSYALGPLPSGTYAISFSEERGPSFVDEFETQFYDGVAKFAEAAPLTLTAPSTRSGIDARLLRPGETIAPPANLHPPGAGDELGPANEAKRSPLRCKKGFVKKKVKGRARCVKKHRHRHRPRHHRR